MYSAEGDGDGDGVGGGDGDTAFSTYPVVIINWVHYLGPPVPFSFPDCRDLLEVLGGLPLQRGTPREDPLGSGRIP